MSVLPNHDFGTVQLFVVGDNVVAYFPKGDAASRGLVRGMRGTFDGARMAWRVDPKNARMDTGQIVASFRRALVEAAPEKWLMALPRLSTLAATTRRFTMKLGEGGMRLQLPQGHAHEYTLKEEVAGAFLDGRVWLLPAAICANKTVKGIILDVVEDDRRALSDAIDYLEGFVFSGELVLVPEEAGEIGLIPGATVFADPSFIRKADANIGLEPLHEYPLRVLEVREGESSHHAKLEVLTGEEGWRALGARYGKGLAVRSKPLDVTHLYGRWSRRRA
jgi:hypothetical protein